MKYEKFEEWMLGKKVTHVVVESSGVIVERPAEDDPNICVRVDYDEGGLAGDTLGAFLHNLEFLEEKPSSEVGAREDSQINWEVGQTVWDTVHGKGEVDRVGASIHYPVGVVFDNGDTVDYTLCGEVHEQAKRSLFFSEPVITAELYPPKKPFTPKLKFDDKLMVINSHGKVECYGYVEQEFEDSVAMRTGEVYEKVYYNFFKLGEEIKWEN